MSGLGHTLRMLGLGIAIAFFAVASQAAFIVETGPFTIEEINEDMDGQLVVGDKIFSDFFVSTTTSNDSNLPDEGSIKITGTFDEETGEYGILITGGWSAQVDQIVDTLLIFQVTAAEPLLIEDVTLAITGFQAVDAAEVSVSEQIYDSPPPQLNGGEILGHLATRFFGVDDERNQIDDHVVFTPSQSIWVTKDILVKGGFENGGFAQLSGVYQSFSQIPEPASMTLLAIGGLILARRRAH